MHKHIKQHINNNINGNLFNHFTPRKARMPLVRRGLQGMKVREKAGYREN